jgi:hypothetical protein
MPTNTIPGIQQAQTEWSHVCMHIFPKTKTINIKYNNAPTSVGCLQALASLR